MPAPVADTLQKGPPGFGAIKVIERLWAVTGLSPTVDLNPEAAVLVATESNA